MAVAPKLRSGLQYFTYIGGDFIFIDKEQIQKAKEKLGDEMAVIIAEELGIEDFDERNMKCCCPFHEEDTPSFIWNSKALTFHCFGTCARNYDIIDAFMYKGRTYIEAVQKLFELANIKYAFGEHQVKTKSQYRYPNPKYSDTKDKVYSYWKMRGISQQTIDSTGVAEDKDGNTLFQYYDTNDVLTMVKVRPSRKVNHGETKIWCLKDCDTTPLLFNMHKVNVNAPLLITTGEGDCLAAIESGYTNSVSIPFGDGNMHWIDENLEWLDQFSEIIIAYDNDTSGIKYSKIVVPRLGSWRCKLVTIPEVVEIDGQRHKIKDLNEYLVRCGRDAVLKAIVGAKASPIQSVQNFSDIKERDMSDIDGVTIGLKELDKEVVKFHYGTFNILSGIPGGGKSSILNQLCAQAVEQDCGVWYYSRELPGWMLKNWIVKLLAGVRNVDKYGTGENIYYKTNSYAIKGIDTFYDGKINIYRDDWANDFSSIAESMEASARRFGSRLFIIDNLMTVDLGANENNKNEKQTEFVSWLIQFAMKYDVCVWLVCHPNKTQDYTEGVGMYNVAGSSNIMNLAHRAIGIRRVTDKERKSEKPGKLSKYDVAINIIKDRTTGKTGLEIGAYYDMATRRFYSNYEEYVYQYKWDNKVYEDIIPIPDCLHDNTKEVLGEIRKVGN